MTFSHMKKLYYKVLVSGTTVYLYKIWFLARPTMGDSVLIMTPLFMEWSLLC